MQRIGFIVEGDHEAGVEADPQMYECLSTRMARARQRMDRIHRDLRLLRTRGVLHLIDDGRYRDRALNACFAAIGKRPLSLLDCVVREMLSEPRLQTSALATFNSPDFFDICWKFRKKI